MASIPDLLERYARGGDQAAFAEVVRTHLDLVYSAALRRVGGNRHAAAEITQEVFASLARRAARLAAHPVLNAWLHAATRNAAIDFHRREQRQLRQHTSLSAMQDLAAPHSDAPDWSHVRDVLDPALDDLGEVDRRVLILRFFENRSFANIGNVVGLREDAARMRVARALGRLRASLGRRGIASTAAALGGILSTHAVTAAPTGLAASVAATAVGASATSMTGAIGFFHLMNTTKIAIGAAGLVLCAGVAALLYTRYPAASAVAPAAPGPSTPASARLDAPPPAVNLESLVRQQKENSVSAATMAAEEKIAVLREILARLPEQGIPELKLATNGDWHVAVDGPLETTDDYRRALAKLRSLAEGRFARLVQPALREFLRTSDQFPNELTQLGSFVGDAVDRSMLQRYRVAPASEIPNVRVGGEQMITQDHLIDSEYDTHIVIGRDGFGACTSRQSTGYREKAALMPLIQAHREAHGRDFNDIAELLPHATTSEQKTIIEKRMREKAPSAR